MTKTKAQIRFFQNDDSTAIAIGRLGHLESLKEAGMVARWLQANWAQVREMAREEDSLATIAAYYQYPQAGWWARKEELASHMTEAELTFARKDAYEASQICTSQERKYMDEVSIYALEQQRRLEK